MMIIFVTESQLLRMSLDIATINGQTPRLPHVLCLPALHLFPLVRHAPQSTAEIFLSTIGPPTLQETGVTANFFF